MVATWYGDDSPHLSLAKSGMCVGGRKSVPGEQARLVETVNIQVRWAAAHPGQDRRLPGVATSVRSRVGIVLEDGSGVAIDWVTGRSCSSAEKATRRLNVQSGLHKGKVNKRRGQLARAWLSVLVDTEEVLREADGPVESGSEEAAWGGKVIAPGCVSKPCLCAGEEAEDHKR